MPTCHIKYEFLSLCVCVRERSEASRRCALCALIHSAANIIIQPQWIIIVGNNQMPRHRSIPRCNESNGEEMEKKNVVYFAFEQFININTFIYRYANICEAVRKGVNWSNESMWAKQCNASDRLAIIIPFCVLVIDMTHSCKHFGLWLRCREVFRLDWFVMDNRTMITSFEIPFSGPLMFDIYADMKVEGQVESVRIQVDCFSRMFTSKIISCR